MISFKTIKKVFLLRKYCFLLALVIALYAIVFSYFAIQRHNAFASSYDLANMDQTIWNTLQGRFFTLTSKTGTISRFSIHTDIILTFLAPLYILWDDVRFILIFQAISIALGAIPVYFIAQKMFGKQLISFFFACIYLLNPALQWATIYDFHAVTLAIPLLLSTFYFAYSKKWKWFIICAFLAILTKEEISLAIVMLGVLMMVMWREYKIGALTILAGATWFLLAVFVIIPYFSPGHKHWALPLFEDAGNDFDAQDLIGIPQQLFTNYLATKDDVIYYNLLLKPFGYFPLFGLPWILFSFPDLLINLFSSKAQMRSIELHYTSGIIPGLMISTLYTFTYIQWIFKKIAIVKPYTTHALLIMTSLLLLFAIRVNYGYGPLPISKSCPCEIYNVTSDDQAFENVLQTIPKTASVTASGNVRSHITHREIAYTLPVATQSADFVAILTEQRVPGDFGPIDEDIVAAMKKSKQYELQNNIGRFYLFKKITY